jgi:hypothetical protein
VAVILRVSRRLGSSRDLGCTWQRHQRCVVSVQRCVIVTVVAGSITLRLWRVFLM